MDATRIFRYQVYSPLIGFFYDSIVQLTLEQAWEYYNETGKAQFAVLDSLSLGFGGILNFDELTVNEYSDVYNAIKG